MSDSLSSSEASASNAGAVRVLIVAISVMTLAIFFLLGAIFGRILAPKGAAAPTGTIDFTAARHTEILLPPGVRVTDSAVTVDRITLSIATASGEQGVFTAPVTGYEQPVRMMFQTAE